MSVKQAARKHGVPLRTLYYWTNREKDTELQENTIHRKCKLGDPKTKPTSKRPRYNVLNGNLETASSSSESEFEDEVKSKSSCKMCTEMADGNYGEVPRLDVFDNVLLETETAPWDIPTDFILHTK